MVKNTGKRKITKQKMGIVKTKNGWRGSGSDRKIGDRAESVKKRSRQGWTEDYELRRRGRGLSVCVGGSLLTPCVTTGSSLGK